METTPAAVAAPSAEGAAEPLPVEASAVSAPTPPAVSLRGVTVARGGRTIWSEGTFNVPVGAVVGVIGPNGSGKTTLLEVLLGLVPIASGSVTVLGGHPKRGDRRIGFVPQSYAAA